MDDEGRRNVVNLPWRADYERTCAECGTSWRVPRGLAHKNVRAIGAARVHGSPGRQALREVGAVVEATMARNAQAEALRQCPHCGAEHYQQRRRR